MRKKLVVALVLVLVVAAGTFVLQVRKKTAVVIPEYEPAGQLVHLDQGWSPEQRLKFHHTAQGTRLVRYRWFLALEQPCLRFGECALLSEPEYLERFGFLRSTKDPKLNPDGLPIGFARQEDFNDPIAKKTYPVVGLTCAACHTGELRYGNHAVRIEGGTAMIAVSEFQKALAVSMLYTKYIPFRYARFEKRVLGDNATEEEKKALKFDFEALLEAGAAEKKASGEAGVTDVSAGFARTDALTRIGNQVFAVNMKNVKNLKSANAAVRFPQIWDSSWFNWVQYNSSISDPLVRNIGEALGVRAVAKLYGPDAGAYENSVHIPNLWELEKLLAGDAPYQGLTSPKWPAVFPALDPAKVQAGAALYEQRCSGCHLPSVEVLKADYEKPDSKYWVKNGYGKKFLRVRDVPLDRIGTDGHEALDFKNRTADSGDLGKGTIGAAEGLELVTKSIALKFFNERGFTDEQRREWSGYRDPSEAAVRAEAIYKARPLNGIWAAAPYLHNGSVPNLYELLSPPEERSKSFWLGSKKFDPGKVGYEKEKISGGYEFNTTLEGDSNEGHWFTDEKRKGAIGPKLSTEDRFAIIEYLKSL